MAQCVDSFTYDEDTLLYCVQNSDHEGPHRAEDCEGFGQIGPATVPVRFTVLWQVET
ncbi:MAG TPA: hypothetical protein VK611_24915 [Acidimicrobiales bacterium]|nr:hypothetical protein [Acidimicrobiales bacterium]